MSSLSSRPFADLFYMVQRGSRYLSYHFLSMEQQKNPVDFSSSGLLGSFIIQLNDYTSVGVPQEAFVGSKR